jgi:4-carboxymuconolactone decarboxylase
MDIEQRKQRGAELIDNMLGTEQAAKVREGWRNISPDFEGYVVEFLAGEIWSRGQLDLRTKSLVTVATLAGMGRTRALELNIRFAQRNGCTHQDVIEALLQIAPYAGFPAAWEALVLADQVFREAAA